MNYYHLTFCLALVLAVSLLYVFAVPAVERASRIHWLRNHPLEASFAFVFLTAMVMYGGSKGSYTNPPAPVVTSPESTGVINLYYEGTDGRLLPIGSEIRRVNP